jgi:hypothetical protein
MSKMGSRQVSTATVVVAVVIVIVIILAIYLMVFRPKGTVSPEQLPFQGKGPGMGKGPGKAATQPGVPPSGTEVPSTPAAGGSEGGGGG